MSSVAQPILCKASEGGSVAVVADSRGFLATGEDTNGTDEMCEVSAGRRSAAARSQRRGRRMAQVRR
jgi:hypothetical protein